MDHTGTTMSRAEVESRLQAIQRETVDLRARLAAARETDDAVTARWYAERLAGLDRERRELEWEIH